MGLFDMFDKLDDIIYKPVEAISNWIQEPLKVFEAGRERKKMEKAAELEMAARKQKAELQAYSERQQVELEVDRRRWNAEIDQMIQEQEMANRERLVEAIKRYQTDLATVSVEIVNSIGLMSLELRKAAHALVTEKTKEYREIQNQATESAMKRLDEINERYANNERVRLRMENSVMNQMDSVVEAADKFIKELSEDLKRLNQNTDDLMRMGMENVNKYLAPMTQSLQIERGYSDVKQIENNTIIDTEKVKLIKSL